MWQPEQPPSQTVAQAFDFGPLLGLLPLGRSRYGRNGRASLLPSRRPSALLEEGPGRAGLHALAARRAGRDSPHG